MKTKLISGQPWILVQAKLRNLVRDSTHVQDTWIRQSSIVCIYKDENEVSVICLSNMDKISCHDATLDAIMSLLGSI